MRQEEMRKVLEVGVLLSAERDLPRLLEKILSCAMELARCDAGTLYLLDGDALRFKILRNNTMGVCQGGDGRDPDLPPVPMERGNVCALSLMEKRTIRIADVYNCQDHDFSGPRNYDARTGYHTRSMLVVPMRSREGKGLGVIQLLNAMDGQGQVRAFSEEMVLVLESIASQAAIAILNARYVVQIKNLLSGFVELTSRAIDTRTPYNVSHSRRMAACGGAFWEYLAGCTGDQERFSQSKKEELRMSTLLHDVGKMTTPLEVMDKAERLSPLQKEAIRHRLEKIGLLAKIACLEGRITGEAAAETAQRLKDVAVFVEEVSRAGFLQDEKLAELEKLRALTYQDAGGETRPWLTEDELEMLSIRKGTLSPAERKIMEDHVVVTDKLLEPLDFPEELSHVRRWAAAHHELLNSRGYPNHLKGEEIPMEVRILTILDVFDAMVADDRPYKRGMDPERALSILKNRAEKDGDLDLELVNRFIESDCWREFYRKGETVCEK